MSWGGVAFEVARTVGGGCNVCKGDVVVGCGGGCHISIGGDSGGDGCGDEMVMLEVVWFADTEWWGMMVMVVVEVVARPVVVVSVMEDTERRCLAENTTCSLSFSFIFVFC